MKLISIIEKKKCTLWRRWQQRKHWAFILKPNATRNLQEKTDKMHLARRRKLAHGIPMGSGMGCDANSAAEFCGAGLHGRHRLCQLRDQVYDRIIYWFNGARFESLTSKGTGSSPIVTINVKMINGINAVQCIYPECRWPRCSWWCWYDVCGFPADNTNANLALVVSTVKIMRNGGGHSVNRCERHTKKRTKNVIKDKLILSVFIGSKCGV